MTIPSLKQFDKEVIAKEIEEVAQRWPDFFPRKKVPELTGGAIAIGTLANLDSSGNGVPGAFRWGRQICYFKKHFVSWWIARLEA